MGAGHKFIQNERNFPELPVLWVHLFASNQSIWGTSSYIGSILLPVTVDNDGAWLQALVKNDSVLVY